MIIRAYYDKDMLYTNRRIIDLTDRLFTNTTVVSFNGGNTIDASIIFNLSNGENLPTYIVIEDGSFSGYHFYVTGVKFIRKNQYNLTLIRDLISESDNWTRELAYVETGYDLAQSDLKYNRYKMNLNSIKQSQQVITDDLSLVLFYQQQQVDGAPVEMVVSSAYDYAGVDSVYQVFDSLEETPFYNYIDNNYRYYSECDNWFLSNFTYANNRGSDASNKAFTLNLELNTDGTWNTTLYDTYYYTQNRLSYNMTGYAFNLPSSIYHTRTSSSANTNIANAIINRNFDIDIGDVDKYNGKICKIDNKFYKISLEYNTNNSEINAVNMEGTPYMNKELGQEFITSLKAVASGDFAYYDYDLPEIRGTTSWGMLKNTKTIKATLEEIYVGDLVYSVTIPVATTSLDKCPTKALVISNLTRDTYLRWVTWATNVLRDYPEFYQAELIPFNVTGDYEFTEQTDKDNLYIKGLVSRDHTYHIDYKYVNGNQWVDKESRFIRIKSASGASFMDITPYLNDGLNGFDIKLSVKPYGTTIYVTPYFGGLYGSTFEDKRGVIIQEDFSINQINDVWVQYKYENQNYLNTFNREIQSIELNNYYASEADRLALERADTEAIQLARETTSASMGVWDALTLNLGSTIGGYTSDVRDQYNQAVQLDTEMNEALRQDNLALTIETFNNNLANIKSIAPTINKVDNFDVLYQYGIIIEEYSCTDVEKEYIINYYQNNGANIGVIGYFIDYYGLVISGKIIKSTNYSQVEMQELNKRLGGGIYTGNYIDTIYTNKDGVETDALKG